MKCSEIIKKIEETYPPRLAEEWDNVGLLVGDAESQVTKVLISLDATDEAVAHAVEVGAQLILTHHPLIFKAMKKVTMSDRIGRRILTMASAGISCYAMHTNFDIAGMADLNARELGLKEESVLAVTEETEEGQKVGFGRIGNLPEEMTVQEFAARVRDVYRLPAVRIYGDQGKKVRCAAICSGSGRSFIGEAIEAGAEVYVTGDLDYHTAIDAVSDGLILLDAGHYGTEFGYMDCLAGKMKEWFPELEILTQPVMQPYTII